MVSSYQFFSNHKFHGVFSQHLDPSSLAETTMKLTRPLCMTCPNKRTGLQEILPAPLRNSLVEEMQSSSAVTATLREKRILQTLSLLLSLSLYCPVGIPVFFPRSSLRFTARSFLNRTRSNCRGYALLLRRAENVMIMLRVDVIAIIPPPEARPRGVVLIR